MNAEQKQRAIQLINAIKTRGSTVSLNAMAALLQELIEQPTSVPVLTVECEPDYWSGGHYHEGTLPHIDPTTVWKLPIGTELYTSPPTKNQSEQHLEMVNAPAPSVPDGLIQNLVQTAMRGLLTDDDMANLRRFDECCQDSDADGHAVAKPKMKRLELAGVVRSCGFGRHETTAFGDWLLADAPEAPALTDERILEIHREVLRGDAGGNRLQTVILMARAIEREILGGNK